MRKDTTINTETKELMDLNITEILLPEKNGFFHNKGRKIKTDINFEFDSPEFIFQ